MCSQARGGLRVWVSQRIITSSLSLSYLPREGAGGREKEAPCSSCLARLLGPTSLSACFPRDSSYTIPHPTTHLGQPPLPATDLRPKPLAVYSGPGLGLSCKGLGRLGMTKGAWRLIRSANESLIHKSKHFPSINLQPVKGNV